MASLLTHSIQLCRTGLGSQYGAVQQWCSENAWFDSSLFSVWERIRKEEDGKEDADLGVPKASDPHSSQSNDQDMSDDKRSDDLKEQKESHSAPEGAASAAPNATDGSDGTNNQDPKSSSKKPEDTDQQQDATASSTDPVAKEKTESVSESHKNWFSRVTKEGQEVLWRMGRQAGVC